MVKRIGTQQRKTRYKLTRPYREKGKISLSQYFQLYHPGDKVGLKLHPAEQHGRFFPRFHGFTGRIAGRKGRCYEVAINDRGKEKTLYVHPLHLIRQE